MEAASSSSSEDDSSTESSSSVAVDPRQRRNRGLSEDEGSSGDDKDDGSDSDSDSSSSSGGEEEDEEEERIKQEQLLPLAERIKRQEEQGVDLRDRRERQQKALQVATARLAKVKNRDNQSKTSSKSASSAEPKKKKKSKHAPAEVSSKRADFYRRKFDLNESGIGVEIGKNRYKPVDPRVSNLTGHLDIEHFETNYAFLQEMRQKEIALLKKRISARKKTGAKGNERRRRLGITNDGSTLEDDQEALKKLLHEKAEFERSQVDRAAKRSVKKKLQQDVAEGKRGVYFPKRKELKRMHVEAKFDELRKRGGDKAVDKAVAKRRKKNKSKDAGLLGGRLPYKNT